MIRAVRLDHHFAMPFPASRAPRRLSQQLECSFTRTVIICIERHIRGKNSHKSNIWEIMPFYDHLRPHQYIRFLVCKCGEYLFMRILFPCGVHIHPQYPGSRKRCLHDVLDLLGACPEFTDMRRTTFRTLSCPWRGVAAVMASHPSVPVDRQGDITVGTLDHMSALPAGNKSRITSPVQKQHDLFFLVQPVPHQPRQFPA